MTPASDRRREAAERIAEFLHRQGVTSAARSRRVGVIAREPDCPIRPPGDDEMQPRGRVGYEPHVKLLTSALDAAVKLGLVVKVKLPNRDGQPSGPWHYYATEQP